MAIDPKLLEEDFEGKIHATITLEDLEEETITLAMTHVKFAVAKCTSCCLDNENDKKMLLESIEEELRKGFCA